MKILITAIGSMSASAVIASLSQNKENRLVGCDIYPKAWQKNTSQLSKFYQVSPASSKHYIEDLLNICENENINYIIPLIDVEIDIINEHRDMFIAKKICLCLPDNDEINIVRDKLLLHNNFKDSNTVSVIPSFTYNKLMKAKTRFPIIAKPRLGRSSEGIFKAYSEQHILASEIDLSKYMFQPILDGHIYTVDYIRHSDGEDVNIQRKELVRTSNGAGTVVEIIKDKDLDVIVQEIGSCLGLIGCVNIEFIRHQNNYFLLDINPRFSAGIAFSMLAGYDFPKELINLYNSKFINKPKEINTGIYAKKHYEIHLN